MTDAPKNSDRHLLLFEPRTEGHHLGWLRFITEDLLSAGMQLTLAVDRRPEHNGKIHDHLNGLLKEVKLISAGNALKKWRLAAKADIVADRLAESGAANVFLCAWDEVASDCWRRAAIGFYPPASLHGRMGGIYHRPRFLSWPANSLKRRLKQIGFQKILGGDWLRQLLFVDEYLTRDLQQECPDTPISFLPDPCPPNDVTDQAAARRELGLPSDRRIFFFYGGGYRRKGLHLAVQAMRELPPDSPAFLLCMGQLNPEGETARQLDELVGQNRALLINRYVTEKEEKIGFAASDVVLLPYIHHFGTSGVLSRAMAAGRMVITSDEELLGRLTREHGLGLLFPTENVKALRDQLRQAASLSPAELNIFSQRAGKYARIYSRDAYRQSLIKAILQPLQQV